jgi:hypothetical protein
VLDANTITYPAPMASSLGQQAVTVTNKAGTSNAAYFSYTATDPIKLTVPFIAHSGQNLDWVYGAGANDSFLLLLALDNTTFNYQGFNILLNYFVLNAGKLNAAGVGKTSVMVTPGHVGNTFYSQFVTFGPGLFDATGAFTTIVTY